MKEPGDEGKMLWKSMKWWKKRCQLYSWRCWDGSWISQQTHEIFNDRNLLAEERRQEQEEYKWELGPSRQELVRGKKEWVVCK